MTARSLTHGSAMVLERLPVRTSEVGENFLVDRALPSRGRRMVGAWCFLDHLGPVSMDGHEGMHVGAHPHTGLQTFTWMIEGRLMHRDSLGNEQLIAPGQVNLMTAGRGIVHTEDSLPGDAALHAAQLWIALPPALCDTAPRFEHYPVLPVLQQDGVQLTVLAGAYAGQVAPSQVHSELIGMELLAERASSTQLVLNPQFEYALLPLTGSIEVGGQTLHSDALAYLGEGLHTLQLQLGSHSRVLLLGGIPYPGNMTMWWNFVGPDRAYVAQAQADWDNASLRFGSVPGAKGARLTAPAPPWGKPLQN